MKKLILAVSIIAVTGGAIFVACSKQEMKPNSSQPATSKSDDKSKTQTSLEKSRTFTEADIIDIIKGRNSSYLKVEEVEDVLLSNCQLSSSILRTLIDDSRYPDYIVEEMMILSAPISSADLTYLHNQRQTLSTTSIVAAGSISILGSNYVLLNDSHRQIMFATSMTRTSTCPGGCGESDITGSNWSTITLSSTTTPLDPVQLKPCSPGGKWICGTKKKVKLTSTDGTTATYQVVCNQSADKCFRDIETAMSSY